MLHITKLRLTTLNERSKAGRKREPATSSEHLQASMKITIPVLSDDCFDLPTFANHKISIRKESDIGDFEPSARKTAALYRKLIT